MATSCSDKLLRVYWRIFVKIFVAAKEFVAATSRTDSVWFDFLRLVAATKFCCGDKDFHKNSPAHTKRFVAATCRLTLLLQLVARPVHTEWSVAATCCSNLSPSVYRPLSPDKRSLVCGSGEELAEDPLTLSAMKSPAYAPDLLLQNCDQMVLCTANHTQTGFSI